MFTYLIRKKENFIFLYGARVLVLILSFSLVFSPSSGYAQNVFLTNLPVPGTMVPPSPAFVPVLLKGMTIHPEDPLKFDFIIDSGYTDFDEEKIKSESERLVKYFLASMTIPKDDLWVNLSPYESDKIIPDELGKTELGRDMLAQDYILKQLTASLMYPEKELGKEFWNKVYQKAQEKYGTTEIPVDTFNKVWILPETATVYEHGQTVYIVDARLKVMLEHDYQALQQSRAETPAPLFHEVKQQGLDSDYEAMQHETKDQRLKTKNFRSDESSVISLQSSVSSEIIKEIILPEIEREVNEGQNFAPLRQIYHSLILAKWYKETIKNSLLSKVYVDKKLINGIRLEDGQLKGEDGSIIDSQSSIVDRIYDQYMEAYKKGVFNYIKEDYDQLSNQPIPRKYFSGGEHLTQIPLRKTNNLIAGNGLEGKGHRVTIINTPQKSGAASPIFQEWRIKRLINKLKSSDWDTLQKATKQLDATSDQVYLRPLLNELKSYNFDLSSLAHILMYIGRVGDATLTDELIIESIRYRYNVYKEFIGAIKELGANSQQLYQAYVSVITYKIGETSEIRSAIKALGELGEERVSDYLHSLARNYSEVDRDAILSTIIGVLIKLRDPRVVRLFADKDPITKEKLPITPDKSDLLFDVLYKLHERIPLSTKKEWPYDSDFMVHKFLPQALQHRTEGYDFKIIHHPEVGHMGLKEIDLGRAFYDTSTPHFPEEWENPKGLISAWVVDVPEKIEIVRGEKLDQSNPPDTPQSSSPINIRKWFLGDKSDKNSVPNPWDAIENPIHKKLVKEFMSGPSYQVGMNAGKELAKLGSSVVPLLIELLKFQTENVYWNISAVLADIGEPAVAPLIDAVNHNDINVKNGSLRALETMLSKAMHSRFNISSSYEAHLADLQMSWINNRRNYRDIWDETLKETVPNFIDILKNNKGDLEEALKITGNALKMAMREKINKENKKSKNEETDQSSSPITGEKLNQVREILSMFGINKIESVTELDGGVGSQDKPIHVFSPQGEMVLRRSRYKEPQLKFIVSVMNRLKSEGIPVPTLYYREGGDALQSESYIADYQGFRYTLEEYLTTGKNIPLEDVSRDQFIEIAQLAAKINNALSGFQPQGNKRFKSRTEIAVDIQGYFAEYVKRVESLPSDERKEGHILFRRYSDFFMNQIEIFSQKYDADAQKTSITHSDLHPGNIKFDGMGKITGLIDFDFTITDHRVIEFNNLIMGKDDVAQDLPYSRDKMLAMVSAYNRAVSDKLSDAEIKAIIEVIRLRFLEEIHSRFVKENSHIPANIFEHPDQLPFAYTSISLFKQFAEDFSTDEKIQTFVDEVNESGTIPDLHVQSSSPAITTREERSVAAKDELGGIDMNAIDLEREGGGVDIQFDPVELQELIDAGIDGFAPVIINITPLPSVLPLLGLEPRKEEDAEELSLLN